MIALLILALSLSLDSLGAGFAYGLKRIRIPLLSKLLLCLMSMLCAAAAIAAGRLLSLLLPSGASGVLSTVILLLLGLSMLCSAVRDCRPKKPKPASQDFCTEKESKPAAQDSCAEKKPKPAARRYRFVWQTVGLTITIVRHPAEGDLDRSNTLDPKEAVLLGLALSLDAFGAGIGYALSAAGWALPPIAALFQFLLLSLGQAIGARLVQKLPALDTVLSFLPGCILLALALLRLLHIF